MSSTILYTIMSVSSVVLILTASITATIGAVNSFSTSFYNSDSNARAAHQYLTVGSALAWSIFIVLIFALILSIFKRSTIEVKDELLLKYNPTLDEIAFVNTAYNELISNRTLEFIILSILLLLSIAIFIVGILGAIGASDINLMSQQDNYSRSAYYAAIITAITGILSAAAMIILTFSYSWIRTERDEEVGKILLFQEQVQLRLNPVT